MPRPRIITETVKRLRELARDLGNSEPLPNTVAINVLHSIANKLDAYDARETRKDPSKRRKATKSKSKR